MTKTNETDHAFNIVAAIAIGMVVGVGVGAANAAGFEISSKKILSWFAYPKQENQGWIYAFQSLIAGILALFAAGFTIYMMKNIDAKQAERHSATLRVSDRKYRTELLKLQKIFEEIALNRKNLDRIKDRLIEASSPSSAFLDHEISCMRGMIKDIDKNTRDLDIDFFMSIGPRRLEKIKYDFAQINEIQRNYEELEKSFSYIRKQADAGEAQTGTPKQQKNMRIIVGQMRSLISSVDNTFTNLENDLNIEINKLIDK